MLLKERELDLVTCGDGERERPRTSPRFLFGRLRGHGTNVGGGELGGGCGIGQPLKLGQFSRHSREWATSSFKEVTPGI